MKLYESLELDFEEPSITSSPLRKSSYEEYKLLVHREKLKQYFKEWEGNFFNFDEKYFISN